MIYSEAGRNGRTAHQLFEELFSHRQTTSHALLAKVYQWASETGIFTGSRSTVLLLSLYHLWFVLKLLVIKFDQEVLRRRTIELKEAVLNAVDEDA